MGSTFILFMSPPVNSGHVFIIIPAYNEEQVIDRVLRELVPLGHSIVVVDDGSAVMLTAILSNLPVYLLRHKVNLGQGAALKTGMEFALSKGAQFIVTYDADGQHTPSDIEKLMDPLRTGQTDITLGSRFILDGNGIPYGKRILLQIARYINYVFTGLLLTDAHNGLRAMTADAAEKIHLRQSGMAHATEIIAEVRKNKLRYREIPVRIHYTDYARAKGQSVWESFRIIFDILLNKFFR